METTKIEWDKYEDIHEKDKNGIYHITDNGILCGIEEYQNGVPIGTHKEFNDDGALIFQREYKKGIIVSELSFYDDGKKESEGIFDEITGDQVSLIEWNRNGEVVYEEPPKPKQYGEVVYEEPPKPKQ